MAAGPTFADSTFADLVAAMDVTDRRLTFLRGGDETAWSFAELADRTGELAARWAGLGVGRGDRVVLLLTDPAEFVLAILAAVRAGVVAVPYVPPFVLAQREPYLDGLRRVCTAAGATVCLAGDLASQFIADAEPPGPGRTPLPCPVRTFDALAGADSGPVGVPALDDPAFIQFTSGSTGRPKGVVVSHRSLIGHSRALIEAVGIDGEVDRGVSWLPLYHDMGLVGKVFAAVATQTPVWYVTPQRFVRDPVGFLRTVSEVRGTIVFAPNFGYGLMAAKATPAALEGLDLSAWRVAGCGAEPVRAETLRRFAAAYAPVGFRATQLAPCYGMAETTLAVSISRPGTGMTTLTVDADRLAADRRAVPVPAPTGAPTPAEPVTEPVSGAVTEPVSGATTEPATGSAAGAGTVELVSCGRPLPGVRIRVVDEAGQPVPDDVEGEITVHCGYLASGYFRDPTATARTWRGGWLHTGDTGFLHDGELYVTGRIKDLIIINGRNYQPHDLERQAEQVDGVRPAGVVAFPTRHGDTEAAHLVVEALRYPAPDDLPVRVQEAVRRRFAIPIAGVTVVRKGTLPKTSSGKVRRRHTAALLRDGRLGRPGSRTPPATPPAISATTSAATPTNTVPAPEGVVR